LVQFGWDAQAAAEQETRERREREIARHQTLSRLGCLGLLGAGVVVAVGAALLWFGLSAGEELASVLGGLVLGVGVLAAFASSAFNMVHFGLALGKRMQRGR
jgi:hypothetical protein